MSSRAFNNPLGRLRPGSLSISHEYASLCICPTRGLPRQCAGTGRPVASSQSALLVGLIADFGGAVLGRARSLVHDFLAGVLHLVTGLFRGLGGRVASIFGGVTGGLTGGLRILTRTLHILS